MSRRLARASVNAPDVLPPALPDPRNVHASVSLSSADTANTVEAPVPAGPDRFSRPARPGAGIALQPLAEFTWGGMLSASSHGLGRRAVSRVCPDHLVIRVTGAALRLRLPGVEHLLRPDSVTYIPSGTAFALTHVGRPQGEVLSIPPALIQRTGSIFPKRLTTGRPEAPGRAAIELSVKRLGQLHWTTTAKGIMPVAQQLNILALSLTSLGRPADEPAQQVDESAQARPLAERFIRLAQRDMTERLTIAEFAQELGVTTSHLDRACRAARGRSPLELLYDQRLERAVQMLRSGGMPAQIAEHLGYVGLSHMRRVFMSATGRAPEDFLSGRI